MKNPGKVIWNDNLSIGNPDVDHDHKMLIEIYNDLVEMIEFNKNREEFAKVLTKMTDYSLMHFNKEEKYMKDFDYPGLTKHRNYHKTFIYTVAMYNVDLLSSDPPDPVEIIAFLQEWWMDHILKLDANYEKYRKDIRSNAKYSVY